MASHQEYLEYILDQFYGKEEISYHPMMGEYILYFRDKVVAGIYDDRFLVKITKSSEELLKNARRELPYEGGKEMFLVEDTDDRQFLFELLEAVYEDLPVKRKRGMIMEKLKEALLRYIPYNDQERADLPKLIEALDEKDIFTRDNQYCHFTASSWIVSPDRKEVLMAYHRLYDSWAWLGGHADGEEDLLKVALKEAGEESGLLNIAPVSQEILSIEILSVDGHMKKGKYVSSHLHYNVTYLLEADPKDPLHHKDDENKAVAWFPVEKAIEMSSEVWFKENIYPKLIEKSKSL